MKERREWGRREGRKGKGKRNRRGKREGKDVEQKREED